jgi:hypothetical protein
MRFVEVKNSWGVVVEPSNPNIFVEEDIGPIEEAGLERLVAERLAPALDPRKGPLMEIRLLRFGSQGDALLLKAHHLVVDGWALPLVFGDVIKSYIGVPLGRPSAMTHERFVREFSGEENGPLLEERDNYFRKILLPAPPLPMLGRTAKGLEPNLDEISVAPRAAYAVEVPLERRKLLQRKAKAAGVTETALVLASYAKTLGQMGDVNDVQIIVAVANRTDRALLDYVGFVNTTMPVRCKMHRDVGVDELAKDLYAQYLRSAAYLPFNARNRPNSLRRAQIEAGAHPFQFSFGQLIPESLANSVPMASTLFTPEKKSIKLPGIQIESLSLESIPSYSDFEIKLRTHATKDAFRFETTYDKTAFNQTEIQNLLETIVSQLGLR